MMVILELTLKRLVFSKMIEDIKNKVINLVIVKDLSRLGREHGTKYTYEKINYLYEIGVIV